MCVYTLSHGEQKCAQKSDTLDAPGARITGSSELLAAGHLYAKALCTLTAKPSPPSWQKPLNKSNLIVYKYLL